MMSEAEAISENNIIEIKKNNRDIFIQTSKRKKPKQN
jgi:hypothetical protein